MRKQKQILSSSLRSFTKHSGNLRMDSQAAGWKLRDTVATVVDS